METEKIEELYETLQKVQEKRTGKSSLTSAHLLSRFISLIAIDDQVLDASVLDLGTGSGSLALGASLVGAGYVLGVDCDDEVLQECSKNVELYQRLYGDDGSNIDLLKADISQESFLEEFQEYFDVVLMNPPAGVKEELTFLKAAFRLFPQLVYAILSPEVREDCQRLAKEANMICTVIATLNISLGDHLLTSSDQQRHLKSVDIVKFAHPKTEDSESDEDYQGGSQEIDESDDDSDDGKDYSHESDDYFDSK